MALSTYSELKAAIGTQSGRDDQSAVAADDVAMAEARIARRLRCRRMVRRTTASFTDTPVTLPSDFLGMTAARVVSESPAVPLKFLPMDGMHEVDTGLAGDPRYYTIVGDAMRLLPAPDAERTVELTYYARVPTLSDEAPTNWLLSAAPDVYLYAALVAFALRLEDPRADRWQAMFDAAVTEVQATDQLDALGDTLTPRTQFAP